MTREDKPMDLDRFEQVLAAYGADPKRWPESERVGAQAFGEAHPDVVLQFLTDARQVDALLGAARDDVGGLDLLAARILAGAPSAQSPNWRPILALAACAVFGVALGFGGAMLAPQTSAADAALGAAFGDGGEG